MLNFWHANFKNYLVNLQNAYVLKKVRDGFFIHVIAIALRKSMPTVNNERKFNMVLYWGNYTERIGRLKMGMVGL